MNGQVSVAKNELEIIFDHTGFLMLAVGHDKRVVRVNGASENWDLGSPLSLLQTSLLDVLERCFDGSGTDLATQFGRAWEEMMILGESGFSVLQSDNYSEDASSYVRLQKVQSMTSRDGLAPRLFAICHLHTREDMLADVATVDESMKRLHQRQLAMDLHDGPLRDLVAATLALEVAHHVEYGDSGRLGRKTSLLGAISLVEHAIAQLREICQEDRAIVASNFSLENSVNRLMDSLTEYAGSTKLSFSMDVPFTVLPPPFAKDVLLIIRQGLFNALRNSFANSVSIELIAADGQLSLSIADDGIGFDVKASLESEIGLELRNMHERAHAMGGTIEIKSSPGTGCTVLGQWSLLQQMN